MEQNINGTYYFVYFDDGHGSSTAGKRTPKIPELKNRVIRENEFNRAVVQAGTRYFTGHKVNVIAVAPTDADTSLEQRVRTANNHFESMKKKYGAKNVKAVYISVHYDAHTGKFETTTAEGHSVFVYKGHKKKEAGKLAEYVLNEMKQGTKQKNRGIKEADFYVLRKTNMVAILTENGFMDNKREAMLMVDPLFVSEVAQEHVRGTLRYFGLRK